MKITLIGLGISEGDLSLRARRALDCADKIIAVVHWVTVLFTGLPKAVMHAEEVCTSDSVTDDTARIRINVIKTGSVRGRSLQNHSLQT